MVGWTTEMETLSQDFYKPVSELDDKELWMSTLTEGSRPKSFGENKICLLCGIQYYFRSSHNKEHLGVTYASVKMVQKYKPFSRHIERYHRDSYCRDPAEVKFFHHDIFLFPG